MGTINRNIAVGIINGKYADDKPVKIVSYLNAWDGTTEAVVFGHDNYNKYEQSPACLDVRTLWTFSEGLTDFGVGYFMDDIEAGKINESQLPNWYIDEQAKKQGGEQS